MYLVDLVQDPCVAVSRVASSCLDVIIDLNDDMAGVWKCGGGGLGGGLKPGLGQGGDFFGAGLWTAAEP